MAFKYVSYAMYPCLAAYAVYSLMYQEHKSWYSYIVGTLVGFVYAFGEPMLLDGSPYSLLTDHCSIGFISMTPQLFINYKMKSVAHMPWKTFMYKGKDNISSRAPVCGDIDRLPLIYISAQYIRRYDTAIFIILSRVVLICHVLR